MTTKIDFKLKTFKLIRACRTSKRCKPTKKSKPKERFRQIILLTSETAETSTTCYTTGHGGQLITIRYHELSRCIKRSDKLDLLLSYLDI
jgi:hypothetical protein